MIVNDNTDEIKKEVARKIVKALVAIGLTAEGHAKELCPVDTGRLRNSIANDNDGENTVAIGTNVEYGATVELGDRKRKAKPYLRPAMQNNISEYKDIAKGILTSD